MRDQYIPPYRPNFYSVIPADVRYSDELSPAAKLLYSEIAALASKEGYCWATNSYFAEVFHVDIRSVKGWIAQLRLLRFIHVETSRGNQIRKIYIINFPTKEKMRGLGKKISQKPVKKFSPLILIKNKNARNVP